MRKGAKTNSARALRRRMTDAERRLWYHLRDHRLPGFKFRRQHPIGPYIVDFVCLEHRLVVELDGGQHAADPDDPVREAFLRGKGYRMLRFWNNEVLKHTAAVCESIHREMSVNPAPAGCGGQAEGC
jgi:very-short-patch-repair endonuclease